MFSGKITTRCRIGVAVRGPSAVCPTAARRKVKKHKTITGNNRAIFRMFVHCMHSLWSRAGGLRVSGNWNSLNLILPAALASLKVSHTDRIPSESFASGLPTDAQNGRDVLKRAPLIAY